MELPEYKKEFHELQSQEDIAESIEITNIRHKQRGQVDMNRDRKNDIMKVVYIAVGVLIIVSIILGIALYNIKYPEAYR